MRWLRRGLCILSAAGLQACNIGAATPSVTLPEVPRPLSSPAAKNPLSLTYETAVPPGFPAPRSPLAPADGTRYSNPGMQMTGGYLAIEVVLDGQPLSGATIASYGVTLATASTDATGRATLGPLEPGEAYTLIAHAPGCASQRFTDVVVRQGEAGWARLGMERGQALRGSVSAAGRPLPDAVVSDGLNSTLSGPDGRYELQGLGTGPVTLSVSKTGHRLVRQAGDLLAPGASERHWALSPMPSEVFFDATFAAQRDQRAFSRLTEAMRAQGHRLVDAPPGEGGVWMIVVPARSFSAAEAARVEATVAQGGKVMLLGEWGGYAGFDNVGTNVLAHRLGVHFNPDLVREDRTGSDALLLQGLEPSVMTGDAVRTVAMYRACSLFGLLPGNGLAWTGEGAYHVQGAESGRRATVLGGAFGAGKVIALSDASAWSDEDADQDGIPNLLESDNLAFIQRLLSW